MLSDCRGAIAPYRPIDEELRDDDRDRSRKAGEAAEAVARAEQ